MNKLCAVQYTAVNALSHLSSVVPKHEEFNPLCVTHAAPF